MCFLPANYDLRTLVRLSRFPLQVTSNKGSNKDQISFCPINSQKCQFPCAFDRKLRFLSPHKAIDFPSNYFRTCGLTIGRRPLDFTSIDNLLSFNDRGRFDIVYRDIYQDE